VPSLVDARRICEQEDVLVSVVGVDLGAAAGEQAFDEQLQEQWIL